MSLILMLSSWESRVYGFEISLLPDMPLFPSCAPTPTATGNGIMNSSSNQHSISSTACSNSTFSKSRGLSANIMIITSSFLSIYQTTSSNIWQHQHHHHQLPGIEKQFQNQLHSRMSTSITWLLGVKVPPNHLRPHGGGVNCPCGCDGGAMS